MPVSVPDARVTKRLLDLLQAYDRDELWLRIRRHYQLLSQPDQLWFEVVDAQGVELCDRFGRVHSHTLQAPASWGLVLAGQLVHLSRSGGGVWAEVLPVASALILNQYDVESLGQASV